MPDEFLGVDTIVESTIIGAATIPTGTIRSCDYPDRHPLHRCQSRLSVIGSEAAGGGREALADQKEDRTEGSR